MSWDLVVIGGGSGGVRAARIAGSLGARVALVEVGDLGGTCVNLGCVPKKLLSYGARYAEHVHDAAGYGWQFEHTGFDWSVLIRNKDAEIARLNAVYERILERWGVELVRGYGTIAGPNTVKVGERELNAKHILVATGGKPWRPSVPGAEDCWVSDDLFHLPELPEKIAVVGGGYIATEFASILTSFGVDTTLVYRGELFLRGFDAELRQALATEMRKKGVKLEFGAHLAAFETDESGHQTIVTPEGRRIEAGRVLLATGRRPNIAGLGLEAAGVDHGEWGIRIDRTTYASSVPGIYAVGDCADRHPYNEHDLTPVALAEGMILAWRLFGGPERVMDYHDVPTAVFANPNFSSVGMSEEHARDTLAQGAVYVSTFTPMVHTLSGRDEKTTMKLVVDGVTDRVVGAHMVGPHAGEIIQGLAVAIRGGVTKAGFDTTIGIHPTAAEEFVTMRTPTRTWGDQA